MEFKSFYQILEESLKGKKVVLRDYEHGNDYQCYEHKKLSKGKYAEEKIIDWKEDKKLPYIEWTGVVKTILQCDNSHIDIIFEKDENHKGDCFNWHMGDYIKILD